MKRKCVQLFLFFALSTSTIAQNVTFNGSVRNSIYAYESEQSHTRFYQYARLHVLSPCKKYTVETSLRALTDAQVALSSNERFKLYSLRFNGENLFNQRLHFSVGRLFLHPGTVLGALDGLTASYEVSNHISLQMYGGVQSHFERSFKLYNTADSQVLGGVLEVSKYFSSKLQLLYLQKSNTTGPFWHLTGVNVHSALLPNTLLRAQAHYDLEQQRMQRVLLQSRNTWSSQLRTSLEYKRQFPQIYANSYFTIFTPQAYQRIRLAAAYEFIPNYTLQLQVQHVVFETDNANQLYLTVGNAFANIGVIWETGYAGEQLGLMADAYYEVLPDLIASVYVDYSRYRVEEIYEYDNQLANAARLSYRFNRHLSVDVEYQWLTNRFKASDNRFLNHIPS